MHLINTVCNENKAYILTEQEGGAYIPHQKACLYNYNVMCSYVCYLQCIIVNVSINIAQTKQINDGKRLHHTHPVKFHFSTSIAIIIMLRTICIVYYSYYITLLIVNARLATLDYVSTVQTVAPCDMQILACRSSFRLHAVAPN